MKTHTYTIGEIARLGLLKNHKGESYKHRATITKIIGGLKIKKIKTPFGMGYAVTAGQILKLNRRWE